MDVADHLTTDELRRLERAAKNVYRARSLRIVILAREGWPAPQIGLAIGLSRRAVQDRVYAYNARGSAGLDEPRGAPPEPVLNEAEEARFRERVAAGPTPEDGVCSLRGRDFVRILDREFGKLRRLSAVYGLLHALGYSYLRPRPKHRRADPVAQAEFIRALPEKLAAIAAAHPGKRLRLFFQDEARFGQQGTLTDVWAPTGSRPTAVRQTEYRYVWVSAAVCPETGLAEGLISPRMNVETVNAFLEQLARRIGPDEHAVMLWDGAGFHTGKKIKMPADVTPLTIPPYSPELNPIENLWHYLKSHHWSNRDYENEDRLEQAVIQAWNHSVENPQLMKTVCAANVYRAVI